MQQKVLIKTFGCQMNVYDSNRIFDSIKKIGYEKTQNYEDANCYILNTCHIRHKAKEKVYHEIGRVKKIFRKKKKPIVIIAGCVAQAENKEMLSREPYIDIVIGPQSYHKINEAILNYVKDKKKNEETDFDVIEKFNYLNKIENKDSKVSSFLTIQEGCDKFCSFCVVPFTRGPEYSRPFQQIITEAGQLIKNGTREIILIGQNVNAYSFSEDKKHYKLSNLILELEKFPELKRIRYTTSHPNDMTDDLIMCYETSKKLMPIIHLPVQSGSNNILKAMNRKHTIEYYFSIYEKIKKINKKIEFSSDFIVGYPGETEKDFQDTLNLINKIKFINSYSFVYSSRPGTKASKLPTINKKESEERLKIIQDKLFKNQLEKNKSFEGKIIDVLVENLMKDKKKLFGRSSYMNSVIFDGDIKNVGKIVKVQINSSNQNSLFGKIKITENKKAA